MRIAGKPLTPKRIFQAAFFAFSAVRLVPHLIVLQLSAHREIIDLDLHRWAQVIFGGRAPSTRSLRFLVLMSFYPEFRNLFYYRTGLWGKAFSFLCRPMSTLFILTDRIGGGLFIQHGFATIIAATEIGKNCWINQQVTIGFRNETDRPIIEDNVVISAGAKIIGAVRIGRNSQIGANAVVVKDIPADVTAVGVPARIVRRNGVRVSEES